MAAQTHRAQALQSALEILNDVCGVAEIPDALKSRARSTLQQLRSPHETKREPAQAGLTWWVQLESTGAATKELAASINEHRKPTVWTAIVQTRTAGGKCSTEALVCIASDASSMRASFAERFGSHNANAASVFVGIEINEITMSVFAADALRMVEELIRRREPFSLEARREYYQR